MHQLKGFVFKLYLGHEGFKRFQNKLTQRSQKEA